MLTFSADLDFLGFEDAETEIFLLLTFFYADLPRIETNFSLGLASIS